MRLRAYPSPEALPTGAAADSSALAIASKPQHFSALSPPSLRPACCRVTLARRAARSHLAHNQLLPSADIYLPAAVPPGRFAPRTFDFRPISMLA